MAAPRGPADARRRLLHGAAALGALALAGCGFQLRRAPELPFQTLALAGFAPRSPLAEELRLQVDATPGTRVVDGVAQAQVVLEALADARERAVVATTAAGQVREIQVRVRFAFRLRTAAGRDLIGRTELLLSRDISYSESLALAKEQEEALLYRAMQSDIVAQVMRRLAGVRMP